MHRQIISLLGFTLYACIVLLGRQIVVHAEYDTLERTITNNLTTAVDTSTIQNPIRDGVKFGVGSPDGTEELDLIAGGEINSFQQAQFQTLKLIQTIINYVLSFIALVVFVYLIFEGYKIVVSSADEEAYKSAVTKLKNAAIAIAGIALSRSIVSLIFYIIKEILTP